MTASIAGAPSQPSVIAMAPASSSDHRGSVVPPVRMISKRFMELSRRRGLMITLAVVTIGLPVIFLAIRLIGHAVDPKSYAPAGGYGTFTGLVAGVLYVFGFIVAATLGCTAGSVDLNEGVFRHLVVTGRSRVAIYFARIPAGLGIILPLVAIGYGLVCLVCCFAAPSGLNYDNVNVPAGLSERALVSFAADHYKAVDCNFNLRFGPKTQNSNIAIPCGPNGRFDLQAVPPGAQRPTTAQLRELAATAARQDYGDYSKQFISPSNGLMVRTGLWLELEASIGFLVGLGLGSLTGQRTVAVVLMIVLEVILTPLFLRAHIAHLINLQRAVVGVATAHLGPSAIPVAFGGGGNDQVISETRLVAGIVVAAWLVVWTALGAWKMARRDA